MGADCRGRDYKGWGFMSQGVGIHVSGGGDLMRKGKGNLKVYKPKLGNSLFTITQKLSIFLF